MSQIIRVSLFARSPGLRDRFTTILSQQEGLQVVHQGFNPITQWRQVVKHNADIVIALPEAYGEMSYESVFDGLTRMTGLNPQLRPLIVTHLPEDHPHTRLGIDKGFSIIGRASLEDAARVVHEVASSEQALYLFPQPTREGSLRFAEESSFRGKER